MTVDELLSVLVDAGPDMEVYIQTPALDGDWTPATAARKDSFFGEPCIVIETRD